MAHPGAIPLERDRRPIDPERRKHAVRGWFGASMLLDHAGAWDSGLHALGYGAIGTMILGVAARVALGHTGRPLQAFPSMTIAFLIMTLGTAFRLFAQPGGLSMAAAVGLWVAAYVMFVVRYLPILLAPRLK